MMRRLLLAALVAFLLSPLLMLAPAWAADDTWFVRTNGHDTNCDGTTADPDDGAGGDTTCAFLTIQKAVNQTAFCSDGDNVNIGAGTFNEVVTFPTVCQCPSASNRCVIDGAGSGSTIVDPGAGQAAFIIGNTGSANRTRFVEFSDMHVKGGTDAGILCDVNANYCSEIWVHDALFTGFTQMAAADIVIGLGFARTSYEGCTLAVALAGGDGNLVEDVTIDGDETSCDSYVGQLGGTNGANLCGSDVFGIGGGGCAAIVRDSTFKDLTGTVIRPQNYGIIEGNYFEHVWCRGDDGCLQNYNQKQVIVRRNIWYHTASANTQFAVHRMRRTVSGGGSKEPSMADYNNTVIHEDGDHGSGPQSCTGTSTSCPPNTTGANLTTRYAMSTPDSTGTGPYGEFRMINNILVGFYSTLASSGVLQTVDGGSPSICPSPCEIDGNVFFIAGDPIQVETCSCTTQSETEEDPLLDSNFAPTSGSPACDNAASYTAWDGDTADMWAGKLQGVCSGGTPPPPAGPTGVRLFGARMP